MPRRIRVDRLGEAGHVGDRRLEGRVQPEADGRIDRRAEPRRLVGVRDARRQPEDVGGQLDRRR